LACTNKFLGVLLPASDRFVVDVCGVVVEYPDVVVPVDQHVLGFDVPMDDSHVMQRSNPEGQLGDPSPHSAGVNPLDEERMHIRPEMILGNNNVIIRVQQE